MKKKLAVTYKQLMLFVVLLFMGNTLFAYSSALQERFQWRNDDGSETTATWKTATFNVPVSNVAKNENIRIRFVLDETEPGSYGNSYNLFLFWSTSPAGTYTAFSDTAGSPFKISATSNFINGELTTEQIGSGNGLTWESLGLCIDVAGSSSLTLTDGHFIEMEYCFQPTEDAIAGQTYFFKSQGGQWYDVHSSSIFASFTMATTSGAPDAHDNTAPAGTEAQEVVGTNTGATVNYSNVTTAGPMNFDRWDDAPPENPPENVMEKYWSVSQGTTLFSGTFNLTLPTTGIVGYTPDQLVIMFRANEESAWQGIEALYIVNGTLLTACDLTQFGQFTIAPGDQHNLSVGSGTNSDPFQIANLDDLEALSENSAYWPSNYYFIQTANIDATATSGWNSGEGFIPIGNVTTQFTGNYNGQGHTISKLVANYTIVYVGLFGFTLNATIQNLGLTDANIHGGNNTGCLVGCIASSNISNCYSTGSVTSTGYEAGGLVGYANGEFADKTITNCYSTCAVIGVGSTGGLVGKIGRGFSISNSYSTGTVTSTSIYAGGLFGALQTNTFITNCYSTGNVVGTSTVGGLVGELPTGVTVNSCYSLGDVSGTDDLGGLVGHMEGSAIDNCYSRGDVTRLSGGTTTTVSAFTGEIVDNSSTINKSYATGRVYYTDADNPENKGFNGTAQGTFGDNFFDSEASNQTTGTGAAAKTTDQMKTQSTYTSWDFTTIWEIVGGDGANYPRLKSNPDPTLPVTLSTFTAQFIENTPTLYWEIQSETDNMGWFVYRNIEEDFATSEKVSEFIEGHGTTTQQQSYLYEDRIQNPEVGSTYYYWLESIDFSGMVNHYDRVAILTIPEQYDPGSGLIPEPVRYGLFQNNPNPFIGSTKISFNLHETAKVELNIYNLKGQLVKTLYSGVTSKHTTMWNGKDSQEKELENGVYFYNLIVNGKIGEIKKLILMR